VTADRAGGGLGSFKSHGELASRLGRASGRRVLLPEYRIAPEHPFPAAINDVLAVWRGLAVALMAALRDAGEDLPAAAVLMSPWTDLSSSGTSMTAREDEDPFSPGGLTAAPG
jgi:epsilon-lactone hydrolase